MSISDESVDYRLSPIKPARMLAKKASQGALGQSQTLVKPEVSSAAALKAELANLELRKTILEQDLNFEKTVARTLRLKDLLADLERALVDEVALRGRIARWRSRVRDMRSEAD